MRNLYCVFFMSNMLVLIFNLIFFFCWFFREVDFSISYIKNYNSYFNFDYDSGKGGIVVLGLCGLFNLGNICFMNLVI